MSAAEHSKQQVFWLFRFSFMSYSVIGFVVAMLVGQMVSWLTGGAAQQIDENLLIPFFQSSEFKRRVKLQTNDAGYVTIDRMLIEMTTVNQLNNDDDDDDEDETAERKQQTPN